MNNDDSDLLPKERSRMEKVLLSDREQRQTHRDRIQEILRADPLQLCRNEQELKAHRARAEYGEAFQEAYAIAQEKHKEGFYETDENVVAVRRTVFEEMLNRGFIFYG